MTSISKVYSDYLHETGITFENLPKATSITERLVDYGYDGSRTQQGEALHTGAQTISRKLMDKRQDRDALFERIKAKRLEVYIEYIGNVKRLRKELSDDPETRVELGLNGKRARTVAGFIEETTNFYNKPINNTVLLDKIQGFGYTVEKLQGGLTGVQDYQGLCSDYEKLDGECQSLAVERDKAIKLLRAWMGAFIATCKVAFSDNLQTLEEINIFIRNRPKSRKQEEPGETQADSAAGTGTDTGTSAEPSSTPQTGA